MDDDRGKGWLLFAGIVLLTGGVMRFFDALWAFRYHGAVPENLQNAIFGHSLSTYGWLRLTVAIVVFLSGLAVVSQSPMAQWTGQAARWIGVLAGFIISFTAIWWMPYYPVWSLLYIGIGVLVIYALVAHGQRQTA